MSQCSLPTAEFIKSTFGPKVAVVGSSEVKKLCLNDGLSLVELLKPFSKLNTEFQIRDPTNTPHVIKGLHLSFGDPFKPVESSQVFRKLINDDISSNYQAGNMAITVKGYQVKQSCPWYDVFRELYFQYFQTQEHDSIMHNLACIIFVAAHEEDPIAQFQSLTEEVYKSPIYWVDSVMMCYHVLVQDMTRKPKTPADETMQSLSTMYGPATCHLLNLHERPETASEPPGPNPWRQFAKDRSYRGGEEADNKANLTLLQMAMDDDSDEEGDPLGAKSPEVDPNLGPNPMLTEQKGKHCGENLTIADQAAIRVCINDFVVRGLLPFNERRMRALNEALNTRRGLRGTFFSATKKLFSPGPKPGVSGKVPANPGYLTDSPEILLRRLGDISFLLQHYTMAYSSYHQVKRDFQNDQAYNHYAAALEMTSLSLFMGSGVRREPHPYYDECINVYLNLCKSPLYAMRATLVHCECLISRGYYLSAAAWFIKMANDENDLNSGLLLEQGAHCYVRVDPPSLRKYAFHLVLAGHRYSKVGQRKHALRCYKNAGDIFKGKGWSLAENHIGFTIGKLSYYVRDIDGAYDAYQSLLTYNNDCVHVMHSQILFQKGIQDFVSVVQIYLQSQPPSTTVELPITIVDHNIHLSLFGEKMSGMVKETLVYFDKAKRQGELELEDVAHGLMSEGRICFTFTFTFRF
ncbi:trafficking protein particle complex subunit 8-like [Bolinopsis microptera]|uniref:trafficking protein particle complex subunit 8-like n=1 Tax=Bolinopsis microptera TaxID=2820187 RepID=UPI00307AC1F7